MGKKEKTSSAWFDENSNLKVTRENIKDETLLRELDKAVEAYYRATTYRGDWGSKAFKLDMKIYLKFYKAFPVLFKTTIESGYRPTILAPQNNIKVPSLETPEPTLNPAIHDFKMSNMPEFEEDEYYSRNPLEVVVTYNKTKADRDKFEKILGTNDPLKLQRRIRALMNSMRSSHNFAGGVATNNVFTDRNWGDDISLLQFMDWYNYVSKLNRPYLSKLEFDDLDRAILEGNDLTFGRGKYYFTPNGLVSIDFPAFKVRDLKASTVHTFNKGGMINKFQQGGQALLLLILAFATDLGFVLGAKDELTAMLTGALAIKLMGEEGTKLLFQVWMLSEQLLQGSGKEAIALVLSLMQQSLALSAKRGSKLHYINILNGHCPAGYEVVSMKAGGCVRCRKKKLSYLLLDKAEEMKCGGKKNIAKRFDGGEILKKSKIVKPYKKPNYLDPKAQPIETPGPSVNPIIDPGFVRPVNPDSLNITPDSGFKIPINPENNSLDPGFVRPLNPNLQNLPKPILTPNNGPKNNLDILKMLKKKLSMLNRDLFDTIESTPDYIRKLGTLYK